jgi:hypothetical protein
MHPAYEHPLPHPIAMKTPQENRHTVNIKASRTECTEATTHYETKHIISAEGPKQIELKRAHNITYTCGRERTQIPSSAANQ